MTLSESKWVREREKVMLEDGMEESVVGVVVDTKVDDELVAW